MTMNLKKYLLLIALLFCYSGYGQHASDNTNSKGDTTYINTLISEAKSKIADSPNIAIKLSEQALQLSQQYHFQRGNAYALKNLGIAYYFKGKYLESLDYYKQSLEIFKKINDKIGVANIYNNIGVIYYDQGDNAKALESYLQSLQYAEQSEDKLRILSALNNIGGVYYQKKATHKKALEYYLKALPICIELKKNEELGAISVNIGSIYFDKNMNDSAMFFFNKALDAYGNAEGSLNAYNAIGKLKTSEKKFDEAMTFQIKALELSKKLDVKLSTITSLIGLGNVYEKMGDYKKAISYYKEAEMPAIEIHANNELKDIYQEMSVAYSSIGDYNNAFKYQTLYSNIKDTLYNIETDKKLGSLQFEFDMQKKQGEINLLTKDKALSAAKLKRQKIVKNAFAVGMLLVFLIALLIFRNYRAKVKTNKILDAQKGQIENLLLNILPAEVAKELQDNGKSTPRNFDSVPVMFTDFKSFTTIADKMSPNELVEELNFCFVAFDNIIEKHNLEKIKTIGDSYMCAAGIPTPDEKGLYNMIKASLEIQQFMLKNNIRRNQQGLESWELRIGIHIGPIVAGVVGKKKYAYDIWGSTVNVASRMESNGLPGQVNVSHSTYELIKNDFNCIYRGKINAKNIGDIDMYFVTGIKGEVEIDEVSVDINNREEINYI